VRTMTTRGKMLADAVVASQALELPSGDAVASQEPWLLLPPSSVSGFASPAACSFERAFASPRLEGYTVGPINRKTIACACSLICWLSSRACTLQQGGIVC
jgi:hypothetical protein